MVARCVEQIQRTSRPLCLALTVSWRPWAPLQGGVPVCRAKEFWVISRQKGGPHEDCCAFVREDGVRKGRSQCGHHSGFISQKGKGSCLFFRKAEFLWGLMSRSCGGLILLIFPGD